MKCSNCGFTNDGDAGFCENCGTALVHACETCGAALKPQSRFCKQCGAPVGEPLSPSSTHDHTARLSEIRKATPRALEEKIRSARPRMQGERKGVTILFTDIVNSTTLAAGLDPEDWKEIVTQAHQRVSEAVYRYEGYIAQLLGDGVLAFFGAPVTHEDDPVRAVQAALDIQLAIHSFSENLKQHGRVKNFGVRVGLNTGLVVLDQIGTDKHGEYLAVGDAVNLAARLQSAAEPGQVLISESTFRSVAHQFDCTDLNPIRVKGKAEPVRVYQVTGVKKQRTSGRGIVGLESKMVGRDAPLTTLIQQSRKVAQEHKGGIALIIGEPGLGKSRLLGEWQKADAKTNGWHYAIGECVSYGQMLGYHLVISLLQSFLGIGANATSEELDRALRDLLSDEMSEVVPYLGQLLGIPSAAAETTAAALDARSLQVHYLASLRRVILARGAHSPVKLVCEDLHWADSSSVELLGKLLPLVEDAPVLFCFTTRPDRDTAGWKLVESARERFAERLVELTLTPISPADSQKLVANLLQIESLPLSLRELILEKSEGNPFFIEEVIRFLIDRGAIVERNGRWMATDGIADLRVPDSLQRLLLARIDRLVDELKYTLRIASVIGREFSEAVLHFVLVEAQASTDRDELHQQLNALEDKGLVETLVAKQQLAFLFRHALVQEAAYEAILKADRRTLHRAVGQALETLFPDNSQELAATLAFHYLRGEDWNKALVWSPLAARRAAAQWALQEAVLQYENALAALGQLEANPALEFELRFELARAMMLLGVERDTVRAEYERALPLAPNRRAQADVNLQLGQLLHIYTNSDLKAAEQFYKRALELLDDEHPGEFYGTVLSFLGYVYRYQYRTALAIETLERALALAQDIDSVRLQADADIFLSGAYLDAQREADALAAGLRGLELANQLGDIELIGRAHSFCSDIYVIRAIEGKGPPEDALPHISEMIRHGREYGTGVLFGFGESNLAVYYELVGQPDAAIQAWQESARIWQQSGALTRAAYSYSKAAQIFLTKSDMVSAQEMFQQTRNACGEAEAARAELYIGLAYAGAGLGDDAVEFMGRAFEAPSFAEQRAAWLAALATEPEYSKHRALPQVQALLDRYNTVS